MLFAIWRLLLFVLFSTLEHTAWPPCCFRVWHLPRSQQKTKHVYLIPNQVEPDDKLLTNRGNGESRGTLCWEFRTWDHKTCCPWHNWQRDNEDGKHQHSLSLQKTMQDLEKKRTTSQVPIGRSYELCVSCGKRNSEMPPTKVRRKHVQNPFPAHFFAANLLLSLTCVKVAKISLSSPVEI